MQLKNKFRTISRNCLSDKLPKKNYSLTKSIPKGRYLLKILDKEFGKKNFEAERKTTLVNFFTKIDLVNLVNFAILQI